MLVEKIKLMLDEKGVNYKNNSKSFILTCPRCSKRDKLYIRKNDGRFVCWVCQESEGYSGKPEFCLPELTGLSLSEVKTRLYGFHQQGPVYISIEITDFFGEDDEIPGFVADEPLPLEPDFGFRDLKGTPGESYLAGRGLPLDVCLQYNIKYWPAKGSVVFPVEKRGKLIGWQTRILGPDKYWVDEVEVRVPKAVTSLGFKKERALMFGDRITGDHAILCEGPIDALKAHLCGGNVATLGKGVSRYQLDLLKYSGIKKLYLALDPDAFIESGKILMEMSQYMEIYNMVPSQDDLGSMSLEEVKALMDNAPRIGPEHIFLYVKNHYAI